jgi:pilus assembly protein CpaB
MKWAIIGLSVLGIAAAGCAALLVNALRAGSPARMAENETEIKVLYAKVPLDAMTVVDGSMVATRTMKRGEAPENAITDPVQVVGRVLMVPVFAEQAFTTTNFASESNASVAAAVGKGKRAVGISVTDYAGLEGLLYPGSVVDVMMTLKPETPGMTGAQTKGRGALTTTLLERVQVLAIERQTVVSGTADKIGSDVETTMRPQRTRRIALLVDTMQAKKLQLAMEQGTLSLALRNPLDTGDADRDQISLRSILGLPDEADPEKPESDKPGMLERLLAAAAERAATAKREREQPAGIFTNAADTKPPAKWETTVIRGDKAQTYTFDVSENGDSEPTPAAAAPAEDEKKPAESSQAPGEADVAAAADTAQSDAR